MNESMGQLTHKEVRENKIPNGFFISKHLNAYINRVKDSIENRIRYLS